MTNRKESGIFQKDHGLESTISNYLRRTITSENGCIH